jgi:hypothetical protein
MEPSAYFVLLAAICVAQQSLEHKLLNINCIVDGYVHVLTILRKALLYFRDKDRHENSLKYYVSRTLTFLFYMLWREGIICILQVHFLYEVSNLNTNDWPVFA